MKIEELGVGSDDSMRTHGEDEATSPAVDSGMSELKSTLQRFASRPRLLRWLIIGIIALIALDGGLWIRQSLWRSSAKTLRMSNDLKNAWRQGQLVLDAARVESAGRGHGETSVSWGAFFRAYRSAYHAVVEQSPDGDYRLDYPPLRLLIVSAWVKHIDEAYPGATECRDEFAQPLIA